MAKRICIAILVMGFSGLVAEIILLRELLIVFAGNELSLGIVLANWLILEAAGCYLAGSRAATSRRKLETFTLITLFFSLFLVVAVIATRFLKVVLGVSIGESIGFVPMFYSSFIILLPVSLLHGALFTYSCRIYADHRENLQEEEASSTGQVYVYETIGTIVGGVACTYLIVPHLGALHTCVWLALLNIVVCMMMLASSRHDDRIVKTLFRSLAILVVIGSVIIVTGQVTRLHQFSIAGQWQQLNVVEYRNSPYGNISVIENEGQYIYFLDGVATMMVPIPDIPFVEKFINVPLLTHPEPKSILIIGGGAGGIINEALKHPSLARIYYSEQDPLLFELLRQFPTDLTEAELNDPRVTVKYSDGRLLLQTRPATYDLIFIGVSEPASLQSNRYFTQEFFSLVGKRLTADGILVLGLPGSMTYLNDELKNLNSTIFHTLGSIFPHVRVIPGEGQNLFLSSAAADVVTINAENLIHRMLDRNISDEITLPWHIERMLHPGWQQWFEEFIADSSTHINHDFKPRAVFYSISHWNALHSPEFGRMFNRLEKTSLSQVAVVPFALLLLYLVLRSKASSLRPGIPLAIVSTGFAGMMFTLMVIFIFQSMYGHLFSWIGLLVAAFMAGAAAGAYLMTSLLGRMRHHRRLFYGMELAIILFTFALPLIFVAANRWAESEMVFELLRILFLAVAFIAGLLVGGQFPLANRLYLGNSSDVSRTAALIYTSDLIGGWLGGICGAVLLLPILGLWGACLVVGMFKIVSFVIMVSEPTCFYQEVSP